MHRALLFLLGILLGIGGTILFVSRVHLHPAAETKENNLHPETAVPHQTETNSPSQLKLSREQETMASLQLATARDYSRLPSLKLFGRVLDPSPLAALWGEIKTAKATAQASALELKRMQSLYSQGEAASARALESAQSVAARDQVALEWAQTRFVLTWGERLSQQQDLEKLLTSLANNQASLIQLELPPGVQWPTNANKASVSPIMNETWTRTAQILGPAPSINPSTQTVSLLGILQPDGLPAGVALSGELPIGDNPEKGVLIPSRAIVLSEGRSLCYVQSAPGIYEKRFLELGEMIATNSFIRSGVKPGEKVVTEGAQQLLSEELKAQSAEPE